MIEIKVNAQEKTIEVKDNFYRIRRSKCKRKWIRISYLFYWCRCKIIAFNY